MNQKTHFLVLLVVSSGVACKGGSSSFSSSSGKPTLGAPQGSGGSLTCAAPQPDPANPQNPPILPCTLDFGGVPVGQSETVNLALGNDGATSYQITGVSTPTDPQFVVPNLVFPVDVVSSVSLAVSFKPFSAVPLTSTFTISTISQPSAPIPDTSTSRCVTNAAR